MNLDEIAAPLVGAWVQVRQAAPPGQEQRNFADAATDAQGITYIVAQASNSTALVLTRKRGDVLLDEVQYPLPDGYRGSGYCLSNAGEVYGYGHKTATDPLWEFVLRIPGFVPIVGGGGPPEPGGGGVSREEVAAMIAQAVGTVPTPAQIVAAFTTALNTGNHPYNDALEQFMHAMFLRYLPAYLQDHNALLQILRDGLAPFFRDRAFEGATEALRKAGFPPLPGAPE